MAGDVMPVSAQNKILPFVAVDTRPNPPLAALATISIENIAEFWNGGPENRKRAEQAADEFRKSRGWK